MSCPMLETVDLRRIYLRGAARVDALRGVSLTVAAGEIVAIVGASGSGKSTLLHLCGTLDRPTAGTVRIGGRAVESLSDDSLSAFRRRHLGFVFQFFNLVPSLSAEENVALPLLLDGQPLARVKTRARELLEAVGLGSRARHRPHELSGGEMQRVAIARALVGEPQLVLADEPTGNLDSVAGGRVLGLLVDTLRARRLTLLMVTHDACAARAADRTITLQDGRIVADTGALARKEAS